MPKKHTTYKTMKYSYEYSYDQKFMVTILNKKTLQYIWDI